MYKLGGSIFVRNAIKYDYCIIEAARSLLPVCDHIVILDCSSTDGTEDLLLNSFGHHHKVTLCFNALWDCAPDNTRLSILANLAKSLIDCEWHFMLQADEVLHEDSYRAIHEATTRGADSFQVRRLNFYGNISQHVRLDIPTHEKPCDDHPTRLGRHHLNALGDGESIEAYNVSQDFVDKILICHYGFVRKPLALVDKTVDAYRWFFGGGSQDERFQRMQEDKQYRWQEIMRQDQMQTFTGSHPKVAKHWIKERW